MHDAEDSSGIAIAAICGAFQSVGIKASKLPGDVRPGDPACGFHLFPDNGNPGCLENACLSACGNSRDLDCAQDFLNCAKRVDRSPNWRAKALVYALIAFGEKLELTLGDSAKKGMWTPDSSLLVLIGRFLQRLCDAAKSQHGMEKESYGL